MNLIKNTDKFQLRGEVKKYGPDLYSFTLDQCWPTAQKPHFTRITQLNLSSSELDALAAVLIRK